MLQAPPAAVEGGSVPAGLQWQLPFRGPVSHTGFCGPEILRREFQVRSLQVSQAWETNALLYKVLKGIEAKLLGINLLNFRV